MDLYASSPWTDLVVAVLVLVFLAALIRALFSASGRD